MQITLSQEEIEVAVHDYIRRMGISCPVGEMSFQRSLNPTTIWAQIVVTTDAIAPVEYPDVCSDSFRAEDTQSEKQDILAGKDGEESLEGEPDPVSPPSSVTHAAIFSSEKAGDVTTTEVEEEVTTPGKEEEAAPSTNRHSLFG